jgi:hypothetical protein
MQELTVVPSESHTGARFFDRKRRDLGWAFSVSKRSPRMGTLTILDVTTTETALADSLVSLDNERLLVQGNGPSDPSYTFMWASGYANGRSIRIQGILE